MYAISNEKARLARLAIVLAVGFFFLPVTAGHVDQIGYANAWAGDQGGGHDRVNGNQGYTSYSASQPPPASGTPCQSCLTGVSSGYTPPVQQTYTDYSASPPASATPCQSCLTGVSSGYTPPFHQ